MIPAPLDRELRGAELVTAFRQSTANNCVAIATTKAAIDVLGTRPLYVSADADANRATLTLRDGTSTSFTREQLDFTIEAARLVGQSASVLAHAHFILTIMASRLAATTADATFESATKSLTSGRYFTDAAHLIGLEIADDGIGHGGSVVANGIPKPRRVKRFLQAHRGVVLKTMKHAWYGSEGVYDSYGRSQYKVHGRGFSGAVRIKSPG